MKVLGAARIYESVYVKMTEFQDVVTKERTEIKEERAQRLHAGILFQIWDVQEVAERTRDKQISYCSKDVDGNRFALEEKVS